MNIVNTIKTPELVSSISLNETKEIQQLEENNNQNLIVTLNDKTAPITDISEIIINKQLEPTINKLENSSNEILEDIKHIEKTSISKLMFDLFELMQLLAEVAKEQREAAREVRQSEYSLSINQIKAQAETQREAALIGMWVSVAFSIVQVGCSAVAAYAQSRNTAKMAQIEANANLKQIHQDISILSKQTTNASSNNLASIKSQVGEQTVSNVNTQFTESNIAKQEYINAQKELNSLNNPSEEQLNNVKAQVETAKINYQQKLDSDIAKIETNLTEKQSELIQSIADKDSSKVKILKQEVKKLQDQRLYAKAYVVNEKVKVGLTDALAAEHDVVRAKFKEVEKIITSDATFKQASHSIEQWQLASVVLQQLSGLFNALTTYATSGEQAAGTELAGEAKRSESNAEISDELYKDAQELFDKVLELRQAITQSEVQMTHQIMA